MLRGLKIDAAFTCTTIMAQTTSLKKSSDVKIFPSERQCCLERPNDASREAKIDTEIHLSRATFENNESPLTTSRLSENRSLFPPIIEIREFREKFDNFFQSGRSGKKNFNQGKIGFISLNQGKKFDSLMWQKIENACVWHLTWRLLDFSFWRKSILPVPS